MSSVRKSNTRRLIIWIIGIILCPTGVISFNVWSSYSQKRQAELAFFVAQEVINEQLALAQEGYMSPDNALVVYLESKVLQTFYLPDLPSYQILSAWVYEADTLNSINRQEVDKVSQNRDIFVYVIAIGTIKQKEAIAEVLTIHPWDETFSSRSGNESYWLLDYTGSEWQVEEKEIFAHFD
jgi:hypothetical protein